MLLPLMTAYKRRLEAFARRLADEASARVTEQVTTAVTAQVTEQVATRVTEQITALVRAEMVELARMLRQQGDADDEAVETFGRALVRLSAEIDALRARLVQLSHDASPPTARS